MGTMNISLPDNLRSFVEEQVAAGGYGTSSEYLRALIRRDKEGAQMRQLLLAGAQAPLAGPADVAYFAALRQRAAAAGKAT